MNDFDEILMRFDASSTKFPQISGFRTAFHRGPGSDASPGQVPTKRRGQTGRAARPKRPPDVVLGPEDPETACGGPAEGPAEGPAGAFRLVVSRSRPLIYRPWRLTGWYIGWHWPCFYS